MSKPFIFLEKVTKIYEGSEQMFEYGYFTGNVIKKLKSLQKFDFMNNGALLDVIALKELTLEFFPGEFTAIAGPSGSGKSTLLNIIGALDLPSRGKVFFEDKDLSTFSNNELADFRLLSLGFIFQSFNLIPVLTALENVEYVLTLQGLPSKKRREKSLQALELVGLSKEAQRVPSQLSGGQQQRVAIARAIVHDPKVVLADEPTANLDSKTSESLLNLMQNLNEKSGMTFIFSSHDSLILSRAKRVIQIRDGMLA